MVYLRRLQRDLDVSALDRQVEARLLVRDEVQRHLRQIAEVRITRMMMMLTPQGAPPSNTAADMAHSTHSTQPALRPHRTTPRAEDKPPQTRPPPSNGLSRFQVRFPRIDFDCQCARFF